MLPGLYVHIPFCVKKCNYCDFFSIGREDCLRRFGADIYNNYTKALINEIDHTASALTLELKADDNAGLSAVSVDIPHSFDTVYIGGGTPSVIGGTDIRNIVERIRYRFSISDDAEITLEVNPGTITRDKLLDYKSAGVNRISMGVQVLDDDLLKFLGRIHDRDVAITNVRMVRDYFDNINVDFIFGIPGLKSVSEPQTLEQAEKCAEFAVSEKIPHVSFYSLIREEGTVYDSWAGNGSLVEVEDSAEREMYYSISKILLNGGYGQYEISNFALPGLESRHNLKYWSGSRYLGLGCGSVSLLSETGGDRYVRFINKPDIAAYVDKYLCRSNPTENNEIHDVNSVYEIQEVLGTDDRKKEYMMLGFRKLSGPDPDRYERLFGGSTIFNDFKNELRELTKAGLINQDLSLTKRGLDLGNEIFMKFV